MHGGMATYHGTPDGARNCVEADRSRANDYYLAYVIDLLAAIPSIIYGIWGYAVLAPHLTGVQNLISGIFGAFPLFKSGFDTGTLFNGGIAWR